MSHPALRFTLLACAFAVGLPAHADPAADPLPAAFARMLAHAPTPSAPLPAAAERRDPLVEHLLRALPPAAEHIATPPPTAGERLLAAVPADPVAAAFQRLLAHTPTAGEMQAVGAAADPLATMLAARLWPASPTAGGRP